VVFIGQAIGTVTPKDGSIVSSMLADANLEMPNTLDLNGKELILDADADTSITADTDDTIDIKIAGSDVYQITATKVDLNGKELVLDADADTSITADTDDRVDIRIGGTDTVHIDASGIGVNINNPLYPLHVTEASGGDTAAVFIDGPTNGTSALYMGDSDDIDIGAIQYNHSSNYMSFRTNAAERMRIDSSGNVMIGETSQVNGGFLTLATSAASNALSFLCRSTDNGHQNQIIMQKSSTDSGNFAATSDNESLGQILFRGVNTSGVSDIGGYIEVVQDGTSSSTVPAEMRFGTTETERMRIDSSGSIFIGNNASGAATPSASQEGTAFAVGSYPYILNSVADASTRYHHQFFNNNGSVGIISTNGSNTTYATSSDYRLKENVNYTWDGTTEIKKLKPCKFNFKSDKTTTIQGFLAHEVAEVVPNAVVGDKDEMKALSYYEEGDTLPTGKKVGDVKERSETEISVQSLDNSYLVPLLVKTIQELEARIATLEGK
jgi:hypothetical protein